LSSLPASAASKLHSPWDAERVKNIDAPYACPAIVHLPADLTTNTFYSDSKGSIIVPAKWKAYSESAGPMKELGNRVVAAADAYRKTGSKEAAACVVKHIEAAVKDGTLTGKMSSNQAYYVQGWVLSGVAVAYLKIRDSGLVSKHEEEAIFPWMRAVVQQTINYYDERRKRTSGDAQNNHLYWAGEEVAAVAIVLNDRNLLDWAADAYREGIKQIQPDGSLPREMQRGQRALHYHLYAASPLVYIAEFCELNGIHLYAEDQNALAKLVKLSTHGLIDNSYFQQKTGIAQDAPNGPPTGEEIGWAVVYVHRFPYAEISALIHKAPSLSYMYLGGLPPYL
jgi:poly(beta-D-mannuronate) lyase